jgi:hypothetical protein
MSKMTGIMLLGSSYVLGRKFCYKAFIEQIGKPKENLLFLS